MLKGYYPYGLSPDGLSIIGLSLMLLVLMGKVESLKLKHSCQNSFNDFCWKFRFSQIK